MVLVSFILIVPSLTDLYTLSLHDALPIWLTSSTSVLVMARMASRSSTSLRPMSSSFAARSSVRSEEHTSELQSLRHLVCRLLLEKKKMQIVRPTLHKQRSRAHDIQSYLRY